MNKLIQLDKYVFSLVNGRWHNDSLDWLFPLLRNSFLWIPLYLFLFLFALFNFKKNAWWWICFAAFTVILTNFISSNIIKEHIFRLRPCNNPQIAETARFLLNYRPQSSGFTSSHASNHFGMAVFFYCTLSKYIGKWGLLFFAWAAIISYAQVYVGVHYPLDVACGGLIGIVFGYLSARAFNKFYGLT